MDKINWQKDRYSVGNEVLDKQHIQIIHLLNNLIDHPDLTVHSEALHDTLQEMLQYAQSHLEYEEKLLQKMGFEDLENHAALHWQYLEKVSNLSMEVASGKPDAPHELISYLRRWWNEHILVEDMQYKPLMEQHMAASLGNDI